MTTLPFANNQTAPVTFRFIKRGMDVIAGLFGCFILAGLLPIIWLANLLWNRGPVFYRQERIGLDNRLFQMLKLRTMHEDAEPGGQIRWATRNDPRATKLGRLLRRSHIDELPQFWHVLIGEMSLVGPRPERPYFVQQITTQNPEYALRHAVKPGITGYAQITQGYVASVEGSLEKLALDLHYIKHRSLKFDLQILLQTVPSLWRLAGW